MACFRGCARRALAAAGDRPSHAWIALHHCVESLARLTGEPFTKIFARLEAAHNFGRQPARWPSAAQIRAAAADLVAEHQAYLARYNALVARRRDEKKAGFRHRRYGELERLEAIRQAHNHALPKVGYWGWRRIRESGS